jgi:hypothetical protein
VASPQAVASVIPAQSSPPDPVVNGQADTLASHPPTSVNGKSTSKPAGSRKRRRTTQTAATQDGDTSISVSQAPPKKKRRRERPANESEQPAPPAPSAAASTSKSSMPDALDIIVRLANKGTKPLVEEYNRRMADFSRRLKSELGLDTLLFNSSDESDVEPDVGLEGGDEVDVDVEVERAGGNEELPVSKEALPPGTCPSISNFN